MGINGAPCMYQVLPTSKAMSYVPKIVTKLFNPDQHPVLSRMGAKAVPVHLLCATLAQFEAKMENQALKCLQESPLFDSASEVVIKILFAYREKITLLCDGIFGGRTPAAVQAHRHHMTAWSVVLLFHLNRWMRALLNRNIKLLLDGFDTTWQCTYLVMLGTDASGLPVVSLQDALLFLGYHCPSCNRNGACSLWCFSDDCNHSAT